MYIANLLGTSTSSALEAVYGQKKKDDKDDNSQNGVYSWREDTVSLSEAALALAQMAGKEQAAPDDDSQESLNGQTPDGLPSSGTDGESEEEEAVSGAGQASSPGGGSGSSVSEIEAKIKQLQQKIVETQNSNLPEDTKSAMISALQAQIGELVQEKNALENQAGKAA